MTEIGGTGVFASAVRDALRAGEIDLAVHSLKDLPTSQPDDLEVLAIPEREDSRDVLVGRRLDQLGNGSTVGTGSPRRALQLHEWARSRGIQLQVRAIRGNVETRLRLVSQWRGRRRHPGSCRAAPAGLPGSAASERSGYRRSNTNDIDAPRSTRCQHTFSASRPGFQHLDRCAGAGSSSKSQLRAAGRNRGPRQLQVAKAECLVERGFLATLEAGCTAPVGARAVVEFVRVQVSVTLAAVVGGTLLSSLSEPLNGAPALRLEVRRSTSDPAGYGVSAAGRVLRELPDLQRAPARGVTRLNRTRDQSVSTPSVRKSRSQSSASTTAPTTRGRVIFVGTGPGDPDLLTLGAIAALADASAVILDSERQAELLAHPAITLADGAEVSTLGLSEAGKPLTPSARAKIVLKHAAAGLGWSGWLPVTPFWTTPSLTKPRPAFAAGSTSRLFPVFPA